MTGVSEQPNLERKRSLFQSLIPLVGTRIGREVEPLERRTIAFAVEETFQEPVTAEVFLRATLMVDDVDSARDAAMKIHTSIYRLKGEKIAKMMQDNPSDARRLNAWRKNIEIGHNMTIANYNKPDAPISIGAVSQDWIPQWVVSAPVANAGRQ